MGVSKFRILIAGSCVSRDILNYDSGEAFELCGYYARSSFASAFCPVSSKDDFSHNITSKFQSAIVKADLHKTLQSFLKTNEFDLLVVDLIDERFSIFCEYSGGILTLSNELFSGGYTVDNSAGITVKSFTDEFYAAWERGWKRFISAVKSNGQLQKIVIHKTFWSDFTQSGKSYAPHFNEAQICAANHFLARLYHRIAKDIPQHQFIEPGINLRQGADEHRWGVSPFNYIDDYYIFMFNALKSFASSLLKKTTVEPAYSNTVALQSPDRVIESSLMFSNTIDNSHPLDPRHFKGNAITSKTDSGLEFAFSGLGEIHQVRFKLPPHTLVDGLNVKFRISDWSVLKYLAIGYGTDENFHHIKIVHPTRNKWVVFSLGYSDLAFGIQNDWKHPGTSEAQEVKFYFKGTPLPTGSTLEIEEIACWKESDDQPTWLTQFGVIDSNGTRSISRLPEEFVCSVYNYLGKCFRDVDAQIESYMSNGTCPLYGNKSLSWPSKKRLPNTFDEVGTYRFSWHALHPAAMMMMHAQSTNSLSSVFSAREFIGNWLEQSYFSNDPDKKFAWYDHGTAERLLSFILMWDLGAKYAFDIRFMSRLRGAIFTHAQLLASEMFYASHQVSRYHNHAWFQDMALMAASLAMPEFPCAESWTEIALSRLEDQLEKLIVRDNGYAVFVENSIGYHQGVQRLISFAGELAILSGRPSGIPKIAEELIKFSDFLKYPDGRSPAQGDTFRRKNPIVRSSIPPKPYKDSAVTVLPTAGYAIVKSNNGDCPYMLSMFATSLCQTHKHEDNLSFTLFLDGIEWLIDPSFYSHEYAKPQQKFLRSAWAHNNVAIKNAHYSIEPNHATLSGDVNESNFTFSGHHTAYDGFEVSRSITGGIDKLNILIVDSVTGNTPSDAFTLFHCGDGVVLDSIENGVRLSHPCAEYQVIITSTLEATLVSGWSDDGEIRAVTGLNFMESHPTSVIAFKLPHAEKSKFNIVAIKNITPPIKPNNY